MSRKVEENFENVEVLVSSKLIEAREHAYSFPNEVETDSGRPLFQWLYNIVRRFHVELAGEKNEKTPFVGCNSL